MKVVFCIPTITKPYQQTLDALRDSLPLIEQAGWEHEAVYEIGCPYISHARATMLRKALDAGADVVVFIDHDVSWRPGDLLRLIQTDGDVVAGLYRFKKPEVEYMGAVIANDDGTPFLRADGCMSAHSVPAGFLKVTKSAVNRFMEAYPELCYGERHKPHVDLFNHGAHGFVWWGEDYAFCRRWRDCGGQVWVVPDLSLTHHSADTEYPGNFHEYMLRRPGGSHEGK
jgi:hypothetical protein